VPAACGHVTQSAGSNWNATVPTSRASPWATSVTTRTNSTLLLTAIWDTITVPFKFILAIFIGYEPVDWDEILSE